MMQKTRTNKWSWVAAASLIIGLGAAAACGDDDNNGTSGNGTGNGSGNGSDPNDLDGIRAVLSTNVDLAVAMYSDAIDTAGALRTAINAMVADPTPETLAAARRAWRVANEPYGPTEVYRFRASPIDDTDFDLSNGEDGPEGELNAWPLGEGLIDYVVEGTDFGDDQINVTEQATGVVDPVPNNIINSTNIAIDETLLAANVSAEDERDVITGYHAIEFMLWGQDLNGDGSADAPRDATPGQRPHTDYLQDANCTSGPTQNADGTFCTRRAQFIQLLADKLVADLTQVRDTFDGSYRATFANPANLDQAKEFLIQILAGMGNLSEGELAGERMQIALSANSQEDEHSCFSDNTHRDIVLNAEGVRFVYMGSYPGYDSDLDGVVDNVARATTGTGIDAYLRQVGLTSLADDVMAALATTRTAYNQVDALARDANNPLPVDLQIVPGMNSSQPMIDTILGLNAQSNEFIQIAADLELGSADQVVDPDTSECDTSDPTSPC
ncbi:MAG: imelysin family protein [Myxococcota bacterium]